MHFDYSTSYTSALLRGRDITPRPPLAQTIARAYSGQNKKLLDIGCGTGKKSFSLANYYSPIIGLEPSQKLLEIANNNIIAEKLAHCYIIDGIAEKLPFKEKKFHVAMSILSWWDEKEVHRVLSANGIFLIECLGPKDKTDFTMLFGKDSEGWRGANLNITLEEMKHRLEKRLSPYFQITEIHNVAWQTLYTKEGLWLLLKNTVSTVRNFHPVNDKPAFDAAISQLHTDQGIVLTQNRLVIIAKKI